MSEVTPKPPLFMIHAHQMKTIYIILAYGLPSFDPQIYSGFHSVIWGNFCLHSVYSFPEMHITRCTLGFDESHEVFH